jgi:transcriptional regulator with XRE-family HTH domain
LEALRRVRTMRGMSQVELAEASGVAQNTISEIELGKREARPGTLRKLAGALGVSLKELEEEPMNWRADYLGQEAEHAAHLVEVVSGAKDALEYGRADYATRFLEILDEGLRNLSDSLHEAYRIEAGESEPERSIDDRLSELLREWEAEKA